MNTLMLMDDGIEIPQAVKIFEKECISQRETVPSIFCPTIDGTLKLNEKCLSEG